MPLVGSEGLRSQKLTTLFCENMLFCHGFKNENDICIYCLQVFDTKWKKNQFEGRKVAGQATMFVHWAQKVGGQLPSRLRC